MRILIFLAIFLLSPLLHNEQYGIPQATGATASAGGGSGCSTFTDNFTTAGALSGNWTVATASGYTSINQGSGFAQSNPTSTKGLAVYSAATSGGDQCSQATLHFTSPIGATGVGVLMDASGNGYSWVLSSGAIYKLSAGAGVSPITTGCTVPSTGDVERITVTASTHTFNVYHNGTLDGCSGATDSTYTTGYPSILIDQSSGNATLTAWSGQ